MWSASISRNPTAYINTNDHFYNQVLQPTAARKIIDLIAVYTNRLITNPDIRAYRGAYLDPVDSCDDTIRDTLINGWCSEEYWILFGQCLGLRSRDAQYSHRSRRGYQVETELSQTQGQTHLVILIASRSAAVPEALSENICARCVRNADTEPPNSCNVNLFADRMIDKCSRCADTRHDCTPVGDSGRLACFPSAVSTH